jgi:hypothetical protein
MPTLPAPHVSWKPERTVRLIATEAGLAVEIALTLGARATSCYTPAGRKPPISPQAANGHRPPSVVRIGWGRSI